MKEVVPIYEPCSFVCLLIIFSSCCYFTFVKPFCYFQGAHQMVAAVDVDVAEEGEGLEVVTDVIC